MALLDRVKGILLDPRNEWPKIAAEATTTQSLYTGYVLILAAIGPIALALRTGGLGFGVGIVTYLIALVVVYVVALIADALSTSFGGTKGIEGALKLVAYSMTASWVAAVFTLIPFVGWLVALAGSVYGIYLFYLGAPVLKKCAPEKAPGYTIVVVLCVIVLQVLLTGALMSMMFGGAMMGGMMLGR